MSSIHRQPPYRWLARFYDRMFTSHQPWFKLARERVLGPVLPSIRSACDLACGTGKTAVDLARKGICMSGVDLSSEMCRLARRRSRESGVPLLILQADMRDFLLPQPVDLILCEYDALNHIPEAAHLADVLACVARALNPGGYFFFDVNMKLAFERVWTGDHFTESKGIAMLMRGSLDSKKGKAAVTVDWFIREGRLWKRRRERVEQVWWSDRDMRSALRHAGLRTLGAWDATHFIADCRDVPAGCRTFYLARKPK